MEPEKIALVTGANKGIGLEIARQLAREGIYVLLGARDRERGEAAAAGLRAVGLSAEHLEVDVTDLEGIHRASAIVEQRFGRLDILVNNAGVALDGASRPSQVPPDVLRRTYETNVFGPVAMIQAFLPLLLRSPAGRIVNVSSGLGSLAQNSDPGYEFAHVKALAYNSSKTALNAATVLFAAELRDTPIKINAADPGFTATDLNAHRGTKDVSQGAATPVRLALLPEHGPTGGFFDDQGAVPW